MKQTIKKVPAFNIIGIELVVQNPYDATYMIGDFWERFRTDNIRKQIPNKRRDNRTFAVYTNYTNALSGGYSLIIGASVEHTVTVPATMVAVTVPEQTYAVYNFVGDIPESIKTAWQTIWKQPLNRAFTFDFEVYQDESLNNANIEIYLALQPDYSQAT